MAFLMPDDDFQKLK